MSSHQAILAMCYECNGLEESNNDCMQDEENGLLKCPLYRYHPHRPKKKMPATPQQLESLKKAREALRK